ncbi:RNA ligase family protein [Burkholderia vietnamiensis]|uniref:RNA ligase family protein n=1 Tax=Burkholderia vietnamiensis TaxID=60552 RepID=UPI001B9BEBDD|nr:RNA ligase family protein [Burkholderia vietnamiensis]MBR8152278.1 RNA ligase family protein [Burkholderia vietnamiensis]
MTELFRFPHTPHLTWLGTGEPRGDKVLSPEKMRKLLALEVVVEEKLDGANLGFSVSPDGKLLAQNRSNYLVASYTGQFSRLHSWMPVHEESFIKALGSELIAFGEWCAARHSLSYDQLPDWWLLFDVYDRGERRFWSTTRRNKWAAELGISTVPTLVRGKLSLASVEQRLQGGRSAFSKGPLEGVVVRSEDGHWLKARAKLVRADFIQHIESHWRTRALEWNRLKVTE